MFIVETVLPIPQDKAANTVRREGLHPGGRML